MQEKRHDCVVEMRLCFFSVKVGNYKVSLVALTMCRSTVFHSNGLLQLNTTPPKLEYYVNSLNSHARTLGTTINETMQTIGY